MAFLMTAAEALTEEINNIGNIDTSETMENLEKLKDVDPNKVVEYFKGKIPDFISFGMTVLLALVIAVPFALLRAKLGIGDNPVGLNANVTLFACGLMLFAVFNAVFLLSFYRTAYKVGVSFVKACIVMAVAAIIMEAAVHFPALSRFNGYDLACQLPLLAAGLVIWCGSWPLIFRGAAARYEKVDL